MRSNFFFATLKVQPYNPKQISARLSAAACGNICALEILESPNGDCTY